MATETTKIKGGAITLPEKLRRDWQNAEVFLRFSDDTLVVKKVQKSTFWETWRKLKALKGSITKKDIEEAVQWARK